MALDIDELVSQATGALINNLSYPQLYNYLAHKHIPQALVDAIQAQINKYFFESRQRAINDLFNTAYQQQQQEDEQEARDDALAQQDEMQQRIVCDVQRQELINSMDVNNPLQQAQLVFFNRLLTDEFPKQHVLRQQRMMERQARYAAGLRNAGEFSRLSSLNYQQLARDLQSLVNQTGQTIHQRTQYAQDISHAIYLPILDRALNEHSLTISADECQILESIRRAAKLELEQHCDLIKQRSVRLQQLLQHQTKENGLLAEQSKLKQQYDKAAARVFNALVGVIVSAVLLAISVVIGLVTASLSLGLIIPAALLLTALVALTVYTFAICKPHSRAVRRQLEDNEHSLRSNERALMLSHGDNLVKVPNLTEQIAQEEEAIAQLKSQFSDKNELLTPQYNQQSPAGYSARLFCSQQILPPCASLPDGFASDYAELDEYLYESNYYL